MNVAATHHPALGQLERRALRVGLAGSAVCGLGAAFNLEQFLQSYLLGYLFWIGIVLGSFALVMLHHLTGGGWGFVIRRCLESATRTLPLMALLILPLLMRLPDLYLWARPEALAHDEILAHKAAYLNVPFFLARTLLYFAIWGALAYWLNRWSNEQDHSPEGGSARRLEMISGPGLAVVGLTVTFASVDWVMSLEPHWFSTIYGLLFLIGDVLATLAFAICIVALVRDRPPLANLASRERFQDLGNLMLAFVMLWAYISFSQYLIIWSGNLAEEIPWYLHRTSTSWSTIAVVLIVFHFALPFVLLLSRRTKRGVATLVTVAVLVLVMRLVDLFWHVAPAFHETELVIHWMDLLAPMAIGGLWLASFARQLNSRPLVPLHHLRLAEESETGGEA